MKSTCLAATFLTTCLLCADAHAHVDISSGPGFAATSQEITFGVGHGCAGTDTYAVTIDIPPQVTSVRGVNSDLGRATVGKNDTGAVTTVTWQKTDAEILDGDVNFYRLTLRIKVPDAPFTTLLFAAHQTCKTKSGMTSVTDWTSPQEEPPMGEEPAPKLVVVPARQPGWNKYTLPVAVDDLATFFADAQIVWRDTAAYSANNNTAALIASTPGVSALTALAANDEVWVKY